ncbi:WS/DGAT/MGAT family acyltransferase [Mycolicibacterium sp. BK556]|uniref:wax ester/triacylglycerol synthase family O-acyltransferase n=1 Tax=Mycobacteriaceae TaxID=1762 RepID=UPI00105B2BF9|nr:MULTISPECIES: wax ester/triacylglycerol synthase family O-acyltransferase [Mycobacteriaceae]MBB3605733.1 WS/DGAT/MGAT family acyltransferase [Mycolicibacterium sp. BK556]MBB3635770.1 WS/DGAT/MGAT family acyltransferase [Mycolicibacterium sp. BK607]MBB3753186.1 WS/DGAT/MGAT family acyltransferase [Mycolicibacterium sp. BK634]TDO09050.1 WS/DGAT/MGAT family acyltransferase [Mycobacterium sp. BK086]
METLDPFDAMMLTAELISSPMHVAVALIMSPPEGMTGTEFIDEVYEQGLTAPDPVDPRLRRRPHRGVETGGLWAWRDVADLDLSHHVHRLTLPRDSSTEDLWALVSELHAEPLDRSAPMWMAYLIDGLDGDRCALYIKIHHIVVDGVAGLKMISDSLTEDPDRREMPPFYAGASPTYPTKRRSLNPLSVVRDVAGAAASGLSLARHVASAEVANIIGGLATSTVATPFGAPRTRFNTKLSPHRVFAATSLDRKRIRAIQDAADVTSNDVVTALITGVLRDWLIKQDELPHESLVALCPVTVRGHDSSGDDGHGNQFGLGLCPLPTAIEDAAERLSLVHYAMSNVKHQVAANGPGAMLIVLMPAVVPTALAPLLPFGSRVKPSYNLPISNVPGPQTHSYFNGASVDEIYPVSVVYDGMALNVTLCSYADRIGVGYIADREVVADVDDLVPLTETALAELEAAVGVA